MGCTRNIATIVFIHVHADLINVLLRNFMGIQYYQGGTKCAYSYMYVLTRRRISSVHCSGDDLVEYNIEFIPIMSHVQYHA